jgi:UDP-GlcNAc:undecaprenyl-phosphate GlcNAc-1-phosphate transferase
MTLFTTFFIALIASMLLVPLLIRWSGQLHLMDVPDARKVHVGSIPRSGGVAIVVGAALPVLLFLPTCPQYSAAPLAFSAIWRAKHFALCVAGGDKLLLGVLAGGFVIAVFGFLDDRRGLSYRWKFFGQLLAVGCALVGGLRIHEAPFFGIDAVPEVVSYPLTALFLLGVTNAINFSDGLDGLAGGISLLTLSAIAWLGYQADGIGVALTALAIMGGICGFLRYNNYPAVVFMGDTGSQFLGFVTAALGLLLTQQVNPTLNPAILLLLFGLPILDTLVVMTWRIRRGESPFLPDRNHFHHRMLEFGFYHYEAVSIIYLTQAALVCAGLLLKYESDLLIVSVWIAFSIFVLLFFRWARVSGWRMHRPNPPGVFVERRNRVLRRLAWLPEASARTTEYALGLFMVAAAFVPASIDRTFGTTALVCALIFGLALLFPDGVRHNIRRMASYLAAVCAVYALSVLPSAPWVPSWAANTFLVVIAATLVLAIRLTRREEFRTTPLDLLIFGFVMGALVLTQSSDGPFARYEHLGDAVVRLAVLFYGGEFLYSKGARYQAGLSWLACLSLVVLAVRGLSPV